MCIGIDNYINSVGNKTKFEIKLTKLFIHKVMEKDSVITFSSVGFEGIIKESQLYRLRGGKVEIDFEWQAF